MYNRGSTTVLPRLYAPQQNRFPGVNQRLIPSRRDPTNNAAAPATISAPVGNPPAPAVIQPVVNPAPRINPPSGPQSRNMPSSHEGAIKLYNDVKDLVLNAEHPVSIEQAVENLGHFMRTFHRKRAIAELMIIDPEVYRKVRDEVARNSAGRRINQEVLVTECKKILSRPAMKIKRRIAVAEGRCI